MNSQEAMWTKQRMVRKNEGEVARSLVSYDEFYSKCVVAMNEQKYKLTDEYKCEWLTRERGP